MKQKQLKQKAVKAVKWDFIGNFASQGFSFIISIFLARILSPEDFGLVGISMAFIAISQIFADVGFASALIQSKKNTDIVYSSVFWLNIGIGVVLFLLVFFSSNQIGHFFNNLEITLIVRLLSLIILINSLNIVQATILKRNLRFKELTIRKLVASVISGLIGIYLAFKGFGVYALVTQSIINAIVTTIVLWKVSDWRPSVSFSWRSMKGLTNFSVYNFLDTAVNQIIKRLDALFIGRLFSPDLLGFFTRANTLEQLVIRYTSGSLAKVLFSTLSKLQNDKERFLSVYQKVYQLLLMIVFFISGGLLISSELIFIKLFGAKWEPSVIIFQILMFKMFNSPINSMIVSSLMSLGKAKENFWIGNVRKVVQLIPFPIAYLYGFDAFLYALVCISFILTILNIIVAHYYLEVNMKMQFQEWLFYIAVLLLSTMPLFMNMVEFTNLFIKTIFYLIIFAIIYIPATFFYRKENYFSILELISSLLKKKKSIV